MVVGLLGVVEWLQVVLLVWELELEVVMGRVVEVLDWRVFVCVVDVGELIGWRITDGVVGGDFVMVLVDVLVEVLAWGWLSVGRVVVEVLAVLLVGELVIDRLGNVDGGVDREVDPLGDNASDPLWLACEE